jgi:hypothetical protein
MIFIEVQVSDDRGELEQSIRAAFSAVYGEHLPEVQFGRVIAWQGRSFQQIEFAGPEAIGCEEEEFFRLWKLPRARLQLGSVRGIVFTTPPEEDGQLCARIREGGRCAPEYSVTPFHYRLIA